MSNPLPSMFVSHGPPTMVIDDLDTNRRLRDIAAALPRPRALLCVSAHWIAAAPRVTAAPRPETIHDYSGFPEALYRLDYPAPGDPELAARAAELLRTAGFAAELDPARGRDHGAWQTAMLMYPEADIPLIQVSLTADLDPRGHLALGRALAPLRDEGVLPVATGTAVHNLAQWRRDSQGTPAWARAFEDWLVARAEAGDAEALVDYARQAPHPDLAHPTPEHLTPLFAALGAGGAGAQGRTLHRGFAYGSLSMAAFAFAPA